MTKLLPQSTVFTTKVNLATYRDAQKIAAQLGFSVSSLINAFLRKLVRDRSITFSTEIDIKTFEKPKPKTKKKL